MIVGLIGSTAATPDDRGRFAQQIATTIPGVRDARITMSEPVRIDGQPGYETISVPLLAWERTFPSKMRNYAVRAHF